MIRYRYIDNQVLKVFSAIPVIKFPINVKEIIHSMPNCKYISYQQLAKLGNCSIDDIIQICESKSGCTHYNVVKDKYLIVCNQSTENNNNEGRQRWTLSHELGHIICDHHRRSAQEKLSQNNLSLFGNPEYESEADYFAATLLAPFPLFKLLNIKSAIDIQNTFGLSAEASLYRYKQYLKWLNTRVKTSWENDMIRLYRQKNI